ncbi:hypothetical protein ARMGADRAFT_1085799 [Armillaria gallica]|uniref:Uncharacterized protein n=1 Tax=Armillaria gallica TaxID=47427 RepID=A0A2H3D0Z9_ARMGA|nr:hypothetical protein ARMGADRAFT_1085799 [Armillaria gallica]
MSAERISRAGLSQQDSSKPSLLRQAVVTNDDHDRLFLALATEHLGPIPARGLVDPAQHLAARLPWIPLHIWSGTGRSTPFRIKLLFLDTYATCRCRLLRCLNYTGGSIP